MSNTETAHEKCIQNFEAWKELIISKHLGRQHDNIKSYAMAVVYPVLFQGPYKSVNLLTTQATNSL